MSSSPFLMHALMHAREERPRDEWYDGEEFGTTLKRVRWDAG
jgi:hypothetical protein